MRKLLLALLVLVVLLTVAVELLAPPLVEDRIAAHVRDRTAGVVGVEADVGPFPVVARLLATERIGRVGLTLEDVGGLQVEFATVRFGLRDVVLDRAALLDGDVRVRGVGAGEVTATIDTAALADTLGVPVRIESGQLVVGSAEVPVPIDVVGDALALPGADVPAIDLVDDTFFPCAAPPTAELAEGRVVLTCVVETVPLVLQ